MCKHGHQDHLYRCTSCGSGHYCCYRRAMDVCGQEKDVPLSSQQIFDMGKTQICMGRLVPDDPGSLAEAQLFGWEAPSLRGGRP